MSFSGFFRRQKKVFDSLFQLRSALFKTSRVIQMCHAPTHLSVYRFAQSQLGLSFLRLWTCSTLQSGLSGRSQTSPSTLTSSIRQVYNIVATSPSYNAIEYHIRLSSLSFPILGRSVRGANEQVALLMLYARLGFLFWMIAQECVRTELKEIESIMIVHIHRGGF